MCVMNWSPLCPAQWLLGLPPTPSLARRGLESGVDYSLQRPWTTEVWFKLTYFIYDVHASTASCFKSWILDNMWFVSLFPVNLLVRLPWGIMVWQVLIVPSITLISAPHCEEAEGQSPTGSGEETRTVMLHSKVRAHHLHAKQHPYRRKGEGEKQITEKRWVVAAEWVAGYEGRNSQG